jgi:DNA-binding ferritin-like protein (Dps family)
MSLIIPGQPTCPVSLSRQGTSGISYGMQYRHQKRRRRSLDFELHVQFTSNQDWDLYQTKMYSFQFYPSYKLLQPSRPVAHHNSRRSSESSPKRMSTSLYLAQSSDSAGSDFGKDDEEKKDREKSDNSKGGGPKPKANKNSINSGNASGVIKGTSTPNNNNNNNRNSNSSNNATKNTNTNDQAKRIGKKNKNKGKTKSGTNASHDSSTSTETGSGGVIKTSNDNTSLKGFKSNKYVPPPTKIEKEQQAAQYPKENKKENNTEEDLKKRVVQLETIVSNQMTEIQKLQRKVEDLTRATSVFSNVVDVLREAGIQIDEVDDVVVGDVDPGGDDDNRSLPTPNTSQQRKMINDDMEIFGLAPKSVTDAADAAGASMLSAILAGKHRMLVDVRDAELTRDPKLFVEFIELAILPVAAGLEGLGNEFRNRVKIVFPTVKDLMQYRRSMALAAPEVVSLSTLGFDPIDDRDNLIVIVAPSPDDIAGVSAMKKLISRTEKNYVEPDRRITQPVVVMNHHMVPVDMSGFGKFTTVYHLRLLSVQYMTGDAAPEYVTKLDAEENSAQESTDMNTDNTLSGEASTLKSESRNDDSNEDNAHKSNNSAKSGSDRSEEEDEALEAAMIHAHEVGVHQGVTRAMVIRAYPK